MSLTNSRDACVSDIFFTTKRKSNTPLTSNQAGNAPVQPPVSLKTYLEEVKGQLGEIKLFKNLPFKERRAIKDLRSNSEIVIKKAGKGTTMVIMRTKDKIQDGQVLLDGRNNYMPLTS